MPRAPQSPCRAPVTVRQRRAKAKRDPSCTRWVKQRPSELGGGNRELAEHSAAPSQGAKRPPRPWVANVRQPAASKVWSSREACPQAMQPLLQGARKRPANQLKHQHRSLQSTRTEVSPAGRTSKQGLSADATGHWIFCRVDEWLAYQLQSPQRNLHVVP